MHLKKKYLLCSSDMEKSIEKNENTNAEKIYTNEMVVKLFNIGTAKVRCTNILILE